MTWLGEKQRHSLSARGIKTNTYSEERAPRSMQKMLPKLVKLLEVEGVPSEILELNVSAKYQCPYLSYEGNEKDWGSIKLGVIDDIILMWGDEHGYRIESEEEDNGQPIWWIYLR